jgi:hypothetical protein
MNTIITRKRFLSVVAMGGAGAFLALQKNSQAQAPSLPPGAPSAPPKPPPLDKELVKDFVIKGHSDLAGTKALLEQEPGLLNSCWDWGGGDFETALEGAALSGVMQQLQAVRTFRRLQPWISGEDCFDHIQPPKHCRAKNIHAGAFA